jgi:predicted phage baseplate assembly protein
MPLDDQLPQIDDRRYDDTVTEIRTRIARYAPEWRPGQSAWTDVNDNDPGVTLAQVFAWQAEMLLYRMNKVPQLNYIKFLQLIGIELEPAAPAMAEVGFAVKPTHASPVVTIPARTQLSADPGDGGTALIFETVRAFRALRARLDQLLVAEGGGSYVDVSAANADAAQGFQPFGPLGREGAELALGFVDTDPLPAAEWLDLAVTAQDVPQGGGWFACGVPDTAAYPPATLQWEYWDGARWSELVQLKDETLALTRSGHVQLKLPPGGITAKAKLGSNPKDTVQRYWIRVRVVRSQYERAPTLRTIRTNTVPVEQAESIRDEVLGGSDGSRNQRFQLNGKPVVAGSLTLEIQQGDTGYQAWAEVDDFFGSGPDDMVYVLNRSTGQVLTGDGVNGAIPVAYVANTANVVARLYRVGGGRRGNVPAGAIDTLVTRVDGIDDSAVGNLLAAYGGRDEETVEDAKKRAPRALKSRCRAVTAEDFEYLAMQAGNVRRAKALPLFHPQFPDARVPGVVSVLVVPDADAPAPQPSDGLLRTVCAYLDARRLLATELYVLRPKYQQVEIRGEVVATDDADLAELGERLQRKLLDYFHPLRGSEDGLGWPFGGTIRYSRVYHHVSSESGVASIARLVVVLDGEEQPVCTDVAIAPHALLYSLAHAVVAHYAAEADA